MLLSAASSAIVLACIAPAAAQDTAQTTATSDEEIIVTGIRGSLQRNLDIKRESSGVVDVISAEDLGKFPDSNVASALQRLPGVAIQRSGSRGDATGVSIRGFGGDFVRTLYDGRQLSTATGGRGIDFTTVGADFVGRLSVYKTPDVELSTSAIGGTIDISLPKPLDREGFVMAASASGSIQSRDKGITPTGGLLVSNTFADGQFGVLGSVAYTRRDTESNQVFIPGWIGAQGGGKLGLYACQLTATCTSAQMTDANRTGKATWFPQQHGINQQSTQDKRIDGRIAVQWQPSDDILLTIDDNYSRQTVSSQSYGYAAWFNGSDLRNVKTDANGVVVDFNQFGTPMDFNANRSSNVYESNQVGANLKIDLAENLKFEADAAFARATRNPGKSGYNDSMDIGYGGTNANNTTVLGANTGVTILGASKDYLPQIHDIGPAGNVSRFLDTSVVGSHVIVRGTNYNHDTVRQFRGAIGWEKDGFLAKLGGQYIDDTLYQQGDSTFTNGVFASRSGYGTCSGRTGGSSGGICPLPANVYQGTVSTSGFIPGYSGNLAPGFFVYDPYAVYKLLEASGGSVAPSFNPGSVLEVHEKTWSVWFKTKFENEIAGMPFTIAAGIRNETTHLQTTAIGRRVLGLSIPAGDPTLIQPNPALGPNRDGYSASTEIRKKSNYTFLLPSIDAKLEITPTLVFRADASRTLTRPGLSSLNPVTSLGTLRVGSLSASGGNPDLKPYLSDNFDAGLEWYYQRNSYLAINAYLKHITNFIVGGVTRGPIDGVIDPSTGQTAIFSINAQINGPEATVKGFEIAVQHVFGDSGFGFQANTTLPSSNRNYDKSNVTGGAFAVTGLAKSANFVGFYDKNGFQIRGAVNWRDEYLSGIGQGQGGAYGAEPVYVDAQLQVDASASYDVTKQFTIFGEVTNINNSTYSTHGRFANQALDIWSYGRRFTGGVRFRY
ncbi:TonB-dependent receptor [Sphingomonas hengshuiensis]|uniref:TonB-dependent receptor n=1 Tax=Sphingomonas hengshuiensis TaxID=1609977 RepID=A0A7U5BFV1_9SPHN|nr:TonB-dependent receptor [Sphingomonas hengshuiensis]